MPLWLLAAVFAALLVLTCLTVAVAQVDLGNLNLYLAMAIATLKAALVVLFFMHLFWDRPFNAMMFVGCLLVREPFHRHLADRFAGQPVFGDRRGRLGYERRPYATGESAEVSDRPASIGSSGSAG